MTNEADANPDEHAALSRVVGLGGSAGSIRALGKFFEATPPDSGLAFIVILHLSPEHESQLSEVLQKSTTMSVEEATDGTFVHVNRVYVIPPGKNLALLHGRLRLTELARERGKRATVDRFFRSLADAHGSSSVAVVLSGADGDGALGLKRVKERGGLTIAQDPTESETPGMPESAIATGMVDWVLPVAEMPARIMEYQAREGRLRLPLESAFNAALLPPISDTENESALKQVLAFLATRTGRDFRGYKRATIVRRVGRRMQVNELDNLPAYLQYLQTRPGEANALLLDLLISVTNFFRDPEAFAALEAHIPELFQEKTSADTVRVWVPACATGEEAYSVAMLLSEHASTLSSPPAFQVFATDLNEEVLSKARAGIYPSSIAEDISERRLAQFFVHEAAGYRVQRGLRERVLFALHDVLKDSPFSRLDLISCRNLLIYLNREAQERVFETFYFALRPNGYLFLGPSESTDDASQIFRSVDRKNRIYTPRFGARRSLPLPSGPSALTSSLPFRSIPDSSQPGADSDLGDQSSMAQQTHRVLTPGNELHFKLLERFGPASLVVSDQDEILHLSEGAARFLQLSAGEPSMHLFHAVHPTLRTPVRGLAFEARHRGVPVFASSIPLKLGQESIVVDLRVAPALDLAPGFLLVTLEQREASESLPATMPSDQSTIDQLERELEQTRRHFLQTVRLHEASTEELKGSNEEFQAMNEELRSASEELETSREELQSINEELTTVNLELKNKVEELGQTNSDLHNLMGATAIATVFLDRDLRIMRFTPSAVVLFNLIASDLGRPLGDLNPRLEYPEIMADAARVLQDLSPIEREVGETGGRRFLARLLPYRTVDDRIAGVVLTFVDVTERYLARIALERAQYELERRVEQRTAELDSANRSLRNEIGMHEASERALQALQLRLVKTQEEERTRISRELHDEIGQQLMALMLALKGLESEENTAQLPAKIRELHDNADRAWREVRQLATELRPPAVDALGLSRALSGYLDAWAERSGIAVDFLGAGIEEPRLPSVIESTIYRVVQEAATNVLRHARAHTLSVNVERRGDSVLALIEDDGEGFDTSDVNEGDGQIGIAGMRERATLVGGELTVESRIGKGTTVRVRLPLLLARAES